MIVSKLEGTEVSFTFPFLNSGFLPKIHYFALLSQVITSKN